MNSSVVSVKDYVNFEGLCSRISINNVSQIKPGSQNGVLITFQAVRKNSTGPFKVSSFPRIKNPTSSPYFTNFSNVDFGRSMKNDIYAVIHDKSLNNIDSSSGDIINFKVSNNKRVEVDLALTSTDYTVDPRNPKQSCRNDKRHLFDCMVDKMTCNPLVESCAHNTSPLPAINMETDHCSVTPCQSKNYRANSIVHSEINDFLESTEFKKFGQAGGNLALSNPLLRKADDTIQDILEFCNIEQHVFQNYLEVWNKFQWNPAFLPEAEEICVILNTIHEPYEYFEIQYGFGSLQQTVITEIATDSSLQLVMDVMGGLGFWLGFSICTIIEFLVYFCELSMSKMVPLNSSKVDSSL